MHRSASASQPAFLIQLIEEGKITPNPIYGYTFYTGNDYPVKRDFVPVYNGDVLTVEILGARWEEKTDEQIADEELKR